MRMARTMMSALISALTDMRVRASVVIAHPPCPTVARFVKWSFRLDLPLRPRAMQNQGCSPSSPLLDAENVQPLTRAAWL